MDAVRDDDRKLIRETLENGESVTQVNAYLRTPLHKACYYSGAPEVVTELIELGADINARDKGNWTCAHLAARNHHNEALKTLLQQKIKIDVTVQDLKHGWTAGHSAVIAGNEEGARLLFDAGADFVGIKDKSGASVFDLLRENGTEGRFLSLAK
jgi:ankyrin repeat protein